MEYTYLGKSGMKVSRLCLGTMNFGVQTDEAESFRIMDAAMEAGISFFDTANIYGGKDNAGATETIIGKWFAHGGGRRENTVLATKVHGKMNDSSDGPNDERGLSLYKIRRHLEGSLRRLQTDHIELYQMHHIDRHVSWEELWGAFEAIVQQGKADYIGSSNFAGWHIVKAQAAAKERRFLGLVSEQHLYNLVNRNAELEVLPASLDQGLGVIVWSPLAGGLLGGRALSGATDGRSSKQQQKIEQHRPQLEAYASLCAELGESQANVALAWLLANPAVTAPIIGPRTVDQLKDTLRAVEIKLDESTLKELDRIFPGPGGTAPEAYAW
ncbi:MAG: oxidoreductase [Paenibacillaceae bacterium]|jgi:aryl-alcohol dehydrogenase-like predicted oxidoreductase|nr:oxidoreductase [Paenibacillaceae bacterium]